MPASSPLGECDEDPGEVEAGGTPAARRESASGPEAAWTGAPPEVAGSTAEPVPARAATEPATPAAEAEPALAAAGRRGRSAGEVRTGRAVPRSGRRLRAQREAAQPLVAVEEALGLPLSCQVQEGPGSKDHQESVPEQDLQGIVETVVEPPGQWEKKKPPQGQQEVWRWGWWRKGMPTRQTRRGER
jgi:pyruvate/2-oxoglutarate dehydrogenase complex dihydrolipoamide acyltransferase (E2) component